jgi:hypothetical protein
MLNVEFPCFSLQADGEVGDRLSGKMRVFTFGDGSSSCSGTLSVLQTQSEYLQTICRDESGRYVDWLFMSPRNHINHSGTRGNGFYIHQ